ncbi:MAG: chemotaxis protein CheD [Pirellulales bacterium]|nr:chemotaxis protein CheD [Pirellulales bacterium]
MATVTENATSVGMGQIGSGQGAATFRSVLGSCIGLAFYNPRIKAGTFAHIVLPEAADRPGSKGKFADTAIPEMIRIMQSYGVMPGGIVAKMAGGANMFGHGGPMQIGDMNTKAVKSGLEKAGIKILFEDTGGQKGRRVVFDCRDGEYLVQTVEHTLRTT